jgi:hypothetical protein
MPSPVSSAPANDSPVDFSVYLRAPVLRAGHAASIAAGLSRARPNDLPPHAQAALDRIVRVGDAIQREITQRDRPRGGHVRPKLDSFVDAWSGCHDILRAIVRIGLPRSDAARRLLDVLFPQGAAFVTEHPSSAWSAAGRRLTRLTQEELADTLGAVVGQDLAARLEEATTALGHALNGGEGSPEKLDSRALFNLVRELAAAITDYTRALSGGCDRRSPASVARFRSAVAPLDDYRLERARKAAARSASTKVSAPSPEVPDPAGDSEADATPETSVREADVSATRTA